MILLVFYVFLVTVWVCILYTEVAQKQLRLNVLPDTNMIQPESFTGHLEQTTNALSIVTISKL